MSIKLRLISKWIPEFILIKELDRLSDLTNNHLEMLLNRYSVSPQFIEKPSNGKLEERRAIMAASHNLHVNALIEVLGFEKALEIGRKEMFKAGYELGCEAKKRLGVGSDIKDALVAARILYKVLGIKFSIEENEQTVLLLVKYCALANHYTPETCKIMSAADEGVLKGLNEKMDMKFFKRITEGSKNCKACINIEN
ncbi:hypothetical protein [Methanobacterium spitsbergense]|uniref:L-2-amino-thiazoline-4-carboxylic acid hydrolase n=1 Tax=Methanobacterium spitsbergense TaxID=2874285 RepID=A0A8T5UVH9_9EURY|nr:hypothetical protein [Methanobacterium spitsbergense]MBZ2164883.1 hypothetical protein [Methanobacterium spitsbergense]